MEHEKISAWMDGELEASESSGIAAKVLADPALRSRWQHWHLAGDTLRSTSLALESSRLVNRVSTQLVNEAIHLPQPASQSNSKQREFQRSRKIVYGGAIAAAVAFVSLIAIAPQMQTNIGELVASAVPGASTPAVLAQPATPVILSDPRLSELLEAHGSMSIRTVSAEVR